MRREHSICANVCLLIQSFPNYRCTLNPSDQLAMEGPLSRVKSIKKSLRQSFRRIRRSRVSLRKHHVNNAAKVESQYDSLYLGCLFIDLCCYILCSPCTAPGGQRTSGGWTGRDGAGSRTEKDWGSILGRLIHWPRTDALLCWHLHLRQWVSSSNTERSL